MIDMRRRLPTFLFFIISCAGYAQEMRSIKMKDPVVCYGHTTDHNFTIPPPAEYLLWKRGGARVKTATIEIIFNPGFTPEAQTAFRAAADIWEGLITSSQTITIDAHWQNLGSGVLGGALYTSAFANFDGAQKLNTFYPVALAEKISGQNLNGTDPEIFTQFSSTTNWHYNPGTPPPSGAFDLVTVVLHEIGHGLGISGSFSVTAGQGQVGLQSTGVPIAYDIPIENGSNANLIETFTSPSANMATQLTSQNLFFDSPTSTRPQLFAPAAFNGGSSISHLDENTYNATGNSLMTPIIAPVERMHDPGIALNMLQDLGWDNVRINHLPLPNTENVSGPYTVTVTVQADNGYQAGTVKLNYTTNGTTYTQVTMAPTVNPNEFTGLIPTTSAPQTYGYFISLLDNINREFVNPGKIVRPLNTQLQGSFVFETGPDNDPPVVTHSPKPFLLEADTEVEIDAKVSDNIGVASVMLEYRINGGSISTQTFTLTPPQADSIYVSTIDFGGTLSNGSTVEYRIRAIDSSVAGNETLSPAAGFYTLNVVGLEPTQDSYANDFNSPSNDFFGNGFLISTPTGFTNGAIHSDHPYEEGDGFPGDEFNLIYQLKIPIRVKAAEATIKFDEVVLVEPGAAGSVFGDPTFFDFVVVEGSMDGGITWMPVAEGYDARDNSAWLTRYNSATSGNNSTAVGDPSLFRSRTLNLLDEFDEGNEVVIRFRLFSDPGAAGWGWCIDNLKIQIDETPPVVLHNHIDYLFDTEDVLSSSTKASDASGIKEYKLEYFVNSDPVVTEFFDVDPPQSEYPFTITDLLDLSVGDVFNYRFVATDSADLEGAFPPTGFIKVPIIEFATPVSTYANNFNAASTDFVGNFFTIEQPTGFADQAIHSNHFYEKGLGLTKTSDYSYTLTKPITISDENTLLRFDEVALVEGHLAGAVFGTAAFNDYVIVEGSKDEGETWSQFSDGYDAVEQSAWLSAFNNQSSGTSSLFRTRIIDMTENGDFEPDDEVIIRFRLFSNESLSGWGWAIDNLYIQDAITSTEKELESAISVYPNPARENIIVAASGLSSPEFTIQLVNVQGQVVYRAYDLAENGTMTHTIPAMALPKGMYFVKISNERNTVIRKIVKMD
jgi:hypothetical protein